MSSKSLPAVARSRFHHCVAVWFSVPQAMLSHLLYLVIHLSKLVLFSSEDVVLTHSPGLKLATIVAMAPAMAWRGWLWRCALAVQSAAHLCLVLGTTIKSL